MFDLIKSIRSQVIDEFNLAYRDEFFYRDVEHWQECPSCARYYELLDTSPIRIPPAEKQK